MEKLTVQEAKRINDTMVTEEHLKLHAANVAACMGAMAQHFNEDKEHWEAIGYLHDYDYEKYPKEHLAHTEEPLREEGVPEEDIRAIMAHGYTVCTDVEPVTNMEKSLFTVDELSGIIQAAARMRPNGITDMSTRVSPDNKIRIVNAWQENFQTRQPLLPNFQHQLYRAARFSHQELYRRNNELPERQRLRCNKLSRCKL